MCLVDLLWLLPHLRSAADRWPAKTLRERTAFICVSAIRAAARAHGAEPPRPEAFEEHVPGLFSTACCQSSDVADPSGRRRTPLCETAARSPPSRAGRGPAAGCHVDLFRGRVRRDAFPNFQGSPGAGRGLRRIPRRASRLARPRGDAAPLPPVLRRRAAALRRVGRRGRAESGLQRATGSAGDAGEVRPALSLPPEMVHLQLFALSRDSAAGNRPLGAVRTRKYVAEMFTGTRPLRA